VVKIQWLFGYLSPFRINFLQTLLLEKFVIELHGFSCLDALVQYECEIIVQITVMKCFEEQKIKLASVFLRVDCQQSPQEFSSGVFCRNCWISAKRETYTFCDNKFSM
jgi:hypothetical protein